MRLRPILLIIVVALIVAAVFYVDVQQFLQAGVYLQSLYAEQPLLTAGAFFLLYTLAAALSIPAAWVLTVIAGLIFGLWTGVLLVSFASTIGATLAFLLARVLLRDWVQSKFAGYLKTINRGIEKDGGFYLFSLRLIPVIPFVVINLVMGLTPLKTRIFYWVSQLGMFPATIVYVNVGAELGALEELSVEGVLTPGLIISFMLLAVFPFIARSIVEGVQRRRVYRDFDKPRQFDTNMVVIGAGSAGLVSAYIAAATKARVTLVEKHKMGGDCLNTGCVPSKALIRAAKAVKEVKRAGELGIVAAQPAVDFPKVMERVQRVIEEIEPHDSVERYTELGVDCLQGQARIVSPWQVEVGGEVIRARSIVIASGASPFVPPIPGIENVDYLTSENLWELRELPTRLLIMGAGPIGCELAQSFQRLGSQVTLVDMMPRILPREDEDVSDFIAAKFAGEGIDILVNHKSVGFETREGEQIALLEGDAAKQVVFDKLLVAVGRKANVAGLGLGDVGVEITPEGTVGVDEFLRTRIPNIYACGDVAGPYQFTHTASHQAWYAAVNALFGGFKKFKVDYSVIPWATFTDPEVAHVGLSEEDARQAGIDYEVTKYGIDDLDRAIADNAAEGFVKVLTPPGKDKILGATIVGYHASDLLTEFVTAMKNGWGLGKILGTIHSYPTVSEANKFVAGDWRRANAPEKLLALVKSYHNWRLGKAAGKQASLPVE